MQLKPFSRMDEYSDLVISLFSGKGGSERAFQSPFLTYIDPSRIQAGLGIMGCFEACL